MSRGGAPRFADMGLVGSNGIMAPRAAHGYIATIQRENMHLLALILALSPSAHAGDPVAAAGTTVVATDPLLEALDLPQAAEALRQDGVPPEDVRTALDAARDGKLTAAQAARAMRDSHDAVKNHGVPPGMGPFVRAQIEAGLTGKELAEAIRKECEARGLPPRQPGQPPPGEAHGDHPHGDKPPGGEIGDGQGKHPPDGKRPPPGGKDGRPPPPKDGKVPPPPAH